MEGGGFATASAAPSYSINGGTLNTNYTLNAVNSFTSSVPANAVLVTNGMNVLAVTADQFSAADQMVINQNAAQAGNLIVQRQQQAVLSGMNNDTSYGDSDLNNIPTAAGGKPDKLFWAEGFGSYRERPQHGDTAFSRSRAGGALVGLDNPETASGIRSGFYIGGFAGHNAMGTNTFRTINSEGLWRVPISASPWAIIT